MDYARFSFQSSDAEIREVLIASLAEIGFEGFEEDDGALHAYVPENRADGEAVAALAVSMGISFLRDRVPAQNWNAAWESGFEPVVVPGFCTVRATFHNIEVTTPYEVVITPKMSFGTGHHATTQLMMEQMERCSFAGRHVLDFGTGTGILAILAGKLGAARVDGIDNDEWSFENACENAEVNAAEQVSIWLGSLDLIPEEAAYDLILANINRHILIEWMAGLYGRIKPGGSVIMSGLLQDDFRLIHPLAERQGFSLQDKNTRDNWIVLNYTKSTG